MKSLLPEIFDDVYCLASECQFTCCMDWGIIFTEEEYERLGQYYGDNLKKVDGQWKIQFNCDGSCSMLTKEGLCSVVLEHGEEALCATGHNYPRFVTQYGDVQEYHLSNGCEAVLRFFLNRHKPLSFIVEDRPPFHPLPKVFPAMGMVDVRNTAIDLMQQMQLPLWVRFLIIKKYAEEIEVSQDFKAIEDQYRDLTFLDHLCSDFRNTKTDHKMRIFMLRELLTIFWDRTRAKKAHSICMEPLSEAFDWFKTEDVQMIAEEYEVYANDIEAYEKFFGLVGVNFLYSHLELLFDQKRIVSCVEALLLQMVLTKGALFLSWHMKGDIGDEDVTRLTAFYARVVEHGIEAVSDFMQENRENPWFSEGGFLTLLR